MITTEEAQQWAGSAWCADTTSHKVLDTELAWEFARILKLVTNQNEDSVNFRHARSTMWEHLTSEGTEPGSFYYAYQANVAMLLYDKFGTNPSIANDMAKVILNFIFNDER